MPGDGGPAGARGEGSRVVMALSVQTVESGSLAEVSYREPRAQKSRLPDQPMSQAELARDFFRSPMIGFLLLETWSGDLCSSHIPNLQC